ncbi:hypothetical protein GCM10027258_75710 [Amycolatopsis stemonae]
MDSFSVQLAPFAVAAWAGAPASAVTAPAARTAAVTRPAIVIRIIPGSPLAPVHSNVAKDCRGGVHDPYKQVVRQAETMCGASRTGSTGSGGRVESSRQIASARSE